MCSVTFISENFCPPAMMGKEMSMMYSGNHKFYRAGTQPGFAEDQGLRDSSSSSKALDHRGVDGASVALGGPRG